MYEEMFTPSVTACGGDSSPARGEPNDPLPVPEEASLPPCGGGGLRSRSEGVKWILSLLPPALLTALFYALKADSALMDRWVHGYMAPVMQTVGKFWSIFPFSVAEVLAVLFLAGSVVRVLRAVILLARQRKPAVFFKRLLAFGCVLLWLWTAFCWTWNCTYYAPGFAEKNGLSKAPYTPEQLLTVTAFFTAQAAALSDDVPRDDDGNFALTLEECFARGQDCYDGMTEFFPELALSPRQAKPLVCSRLQSILGYTGIYFPFTGEANVNVDQVTTLVPFTIAHEMAHQRMVASEQECNFLGVLACLSSGDPVFQYSGYFMGSIYLNNALRMLSPELADQVLTHYLTEELRHDWDENYRYWDALSSPTQEKAEQAMDQVYDSYLKSQGQSLGLMSYSACVDLLVNFFCPAN